MFRDLILATIAYLDARQRYRVIKHEHDMPFDGPKTPYELLIKSREDMDQANANMLAAADAIDRALFVPESPDATTEPMPAAQTDNR